MGFYLFNTGGSSPSSSSPGSPLPLLKTLYFAALSASFYAGYNQVDATAVVDNAVDAIAEFRTIDPSSIDRRDNNWIDRQLHNVQKEFSKLERKEQMYSDLRAWDAEHNPHFTHKRIVRYASGLLAVNVAMTVLGNLGVGVGGARRRR